MKTTLPQIRKHFGIWHSNRCHVAPTTRVVETFSVAIAYIWLFLMFWPGQLFVRNPGLAGLGKAMPEHDWMAFFGALCVVQTAGLIMGFPIIRISGLLGAFFFWLSLAWDLSPGRPHYGWLPLSPAVGTYVVDTLACLWACMKLWPWVTVDVFLRFAFWRGHRLAQGQSKRANRPRPSARGK